MLSFIHSYQYVDLEKTKNILLKNDYILDNKKNKLIKLHNIPKNELYSIYVNKLLTKKKSITSRIIKTKNIRNEVNIAIHIDINYCKIIEYIESGLALVPYQIDAQL